MYNFRFPHLVTPPVHLPKELNAWGGGGEAEGDKKELYT